MTCSKTKITNYSGFSYKVETNSINPIIFERNTDIQIHHNIHVSDLTETKEI